MNKSIHSSWLILIVLVVILTICGFILFNTTRNSASVELNVPESTGSDQVALRIGLIPERNIFEQRQRYRELADYLAERLDLPVELVTNSSYAGILHDFEQNKVDFAFLGSLVASMVMRQHDAQVVLKPELPGGVTTYHGVIFVMDDSAIHSVADLPGRSIAMVRTTTAADLFPTWTLAHQGLLKGTDTPRIRWVGTHDDAIAEVISGRVDAGAAKNLRLDHYLSEHSSVAVRRLEVGPEVPNNALIVSSRLDSSIAGQLVEILGTMHESEEGRAILEVFGAKKFVPCEAAEYQVINEMIEELGDLWPILGAHNQNSLLQQFALPLESDTE